MVEIKHTPTPWAYEDTGGIAWIDRKSTDRPTVGRVGDCRIVRDGALRYDDHAEDHEDAAFVCLAVNSYAADQERIRVLTEALNRLSGLTPRRANARTATDLHLTVKAIADTVLADGDLGPEQPWLASAALSSGGSNHD